jgi:phosphatidylserine decarboxylase precursor
VDGAISQFGAIERDQIFQAKGHSYSTTALVGGDRELAARFENGSFATLYLSPRDYHRIHMPCAGKLTRMIYVPGALFSVNPTTARGVPGLFARNERVVCVFESAFGPFVLTLVGATIVGSMATVWHGVVNPPRPGVVREWRYDEQNARCPEKGQEMGRFLLGSTVVMLFPKDTLAFNPDWAPTRAIRMGEAMGSHWPAWLCRPDCSTGKGAGPANWLPGRIGRVPAGKRNSAVWQQLHLPRACPGGRMVPGATATGWSDAAGCRLYRQFAPRHGTIAIETPLRRLEHVAVADRQVIEQPDLDIAGQLVRPDMHEASGVSLISVLCAMYRAFSGQRPPSAPIGKHLRRYRWSALWPMVLPIDIGDAAVGKLQFVGGLAARPIDQHVVENMVLAGPRLDQMPEVAIGKAAAAQAELADGADIEQVMQAALGMRAHRRTRCRSPPASCRRGWRSGGPSRCRKRRSRGTSIALLKADTGAIAIGHPRPAKLDVLDRTLPPRTTQIALPSALLPSASMTGRSPAPRMISLSCVHTAGWPRYSPGRISITSPSRACLAASLMLE